MNFSRAIVVALAAASLLSGACDPEEKTQTSNPNAGFAIRVERGTESAQTLTSHSEPIRRTLAFEMTGFSPLPADASGTEQRTGVTQGAIIDAFVKSMIEARRNRGQTTSDFTARIGPRVTVVHRQLGESYEAEITLISRGVDTTFVVRDGVLTHPPHEFRLLRQIFDETNGEFALLSTKWLPAARGCEARVGCYQPMTPAPALAGNPADNPGQ